MVTELDPVRLGQRWGAPSLQRGTVHIHSPLGSSDPIVLWLDFPGEFCHFMSVDFICFIAAFKTPPRTQCIQTTVLLYVTGPPLSSSFLFLCKENPTFYCV